MAVFGGGINVKTKEWFALRERGTYMSNLPSNWDSKDVPEWAMYLAVDEDGSEWFYEHEPIKHGNRWIASEGMAIPRFRTCSNWGNTLIKRKQPKPKVFGEELNKVRKQRERNKKKVKKKKEKKLTLLQKYGVDQCTHTRFGDYHIKRIIIWTKPSGEKVYCSHVSGNRCDNYRSYKFTDKITRAKLYLREMLAIEAIGIISEMNGIPKEELSYITHLYRKNENGKYIRCNYRIMDRYYGYLEEYAQQQLLKQQEKENVNGRQMASSITDEETQGNEFKNEGD